MRLPDPQKMIGLISRISDGVFEPVNERSRDRLAQVFFFRPTLEFKFTREELPMVRELARKKGYHVITTNRMIKPVSKILMLVLVLASSMSMIGCNALSKLTDGPTHHDQPNLAPEAYHSLAQSPQTTIQGNPTSATARIEAYYSQPWPWQVNDPRNKIPVYSQLQPGVTTVYAIWNYTAPTLTVEFINIPSQATPPFDVYVVSFPS